MTVQTRSAKRRQPPPTDLRLVLKQLARPLTPPFILLLAAGLRFYQLSGQSLWADEGNSVALARRGFAEIARRTAFDIHPPLYYWLLKIWVFVFGDSEIGLRSLSVVLGIGLVYLIGVLGTRLFHARIGLIAAFIAAVSPLQVYYSQEARMYMLLAMLSALTVLAAGFIWESYAAAQKTVAGPIYVVAVTAGLYTHYAYPLILIGVNLAALIWFWQTWPADASKSGANQPLPIANFRQSPLAHLQNWCWLQLIPWLLYLPWLPIAWRQITTWPAGRAAGSLLADLDKISTTLLLGLSWPYNLGTAPTVGLGVILLITVWLGFKQAVPRWRYPAHRLFTTLSLSLLWLWLLLPVILTAIIFSPAFLKFLLVAAPPVALLVALAIERIALELGRFRRPLPGRGPDRLSEVSWLGYLVGGGLLAVLSGASALSLNYYYHDPAYARDNYRGIVNFIKAISGPDDAVILNAEGQQDVFNYYYGRGLGGLAPVYPLPRQRPLDEAATLKELQQITDKAGKVYAVYWATRQADPNGLIEGWLDSHLSKATDLWYGNVRLVSYATPQARANLRLTPVSYQLGQNIRLTGYALSSTRISPGDILQIVLAWETDKPMTGDFTVFAQILDPANHLVGQRDAQPLTATSSWPAGQLVMDGHGIFIEPGTPPGKHRLIVGLYDSATGQRLPVTSSDGEQRRDFIELSEVEIVRPATPLPLDAFNIQVRLNRPMVDVVLLGYDLYKTGHRSTPNAPLHPGDPLHLVAYWMPRWPVRWLEDQLFIQVITNTGRPSPLFVTRHPSGTDYSIKQWQPGEIIRAQYDLFLTNLEPGTYRLALTLGVSKVSNQRVVAVTQPFRVE